MTSSNKITEAIDAALKFLGYSRLRSAYEDEDSYFFTACYDDGETIFGEAMCRVDKKTLECSICPRTDPKHYSYKKKLEVPKERQEVLMEEQYGN